MGTFLRSATGSDDNILGGPARILIAPTTTAVPTTIGDIIQLGTTATNEIQSLTTSGTPTAGTIRLIVAGVGTTAPIAYNATAAVVASALSAIGVTATTGGGPLPTAVTLTFTGAYAGNNVPEIQVDSSGLTPNTARGVIATTTQGSGQYDALNGWIDLGATKNGIQLVRNNSEQAWDVDQVAGDIRTFPTSWEQSVRTSLSEASLANFAYTWETLQPTLNAATGEEYLGIGAPESYVTRRLAVLFQKKGSDGNPTGIRAHVFRKVTHTPQESSINFQKATEQITLPVSFKCLADDTSASINDRFGFILNQR